MALPDEADVTSDADVETRFAASVRANFIALAPSSLAFALVALASSVAIFWGHSNSVNLAIWGLSQSVIMLAHTWFARRASAQHFLRWAVAGEAIASAWWPMMLVIAPARTADWQTMQGVLLIGLMLSTLGNTTASKHIHFASAAPLAIFGAIAFFLVGDGAAQWLTAGFAVGLPFTITAGAVIRQGQVDLFASSIRAEDLATNLHSEGLRLKNANSQLERANGHLDAQSRRDTLTGLYNRAGFLSLLTEAVSKQPGKVVVCYLDLDEFKRINDAFGHRFGDLILCAVSERISRVLLENEVLARQGGDELTIFGFIDDLNGDVEDLGQRVLSVFADPFLIEGRQITVSVSAGLVWLPEETTADDLMRFADTALYNAKDAGRNRMAVFDDAMRSELDRRTQLQADLGTAFDRSEITPYLQPIVDIRTGRISCAEALARWEQPDGVKTAADFIGTASDLGMLDRINEIVVDKVFDFQRTYALVDRSCPITVNVSPLHLDAMMTRVLREKDVEQVIFEITEDGIFADMDRARDQLLRAQAAGIRVLLDDFGVGFSSLSIATQLPIDGFKIDRGFVASLAGNPSALAVVEAITQLAARMNLHVVAEGVETVEQLLLLRDLGVGFAQGYFFSPAVPMDTFGEWLRTDFSFDVPALAVPPMTSVL